MKIAIQCDSYKKERYLKELNENKVHINFHGDLESTVNVYFFSVDSEEKKVRDIVTKVEEEYLKYEAKWN